MVGCRRTWCKRSTQGLAHAGGSTRCDKGEARGTAAGAHPIEAGAAHGDKLDATGSQHIHHLREQKGMRLWMNNWQSGTAL